MRRSVVLVLALLVAGAVPATAAEGPSAVSVLAPGNSTTYTMEGQARGTATGDPDDFGAHVDDQRELYGDFEFKDGRFRDRCDDPLVPRPGVEVCYDGFGVPAIWGETGEDVWFGAGYAVARIRLFLMDATIRTARGTLAELTGPDGVPADVATRTTGYSDAELTAMYGRTSAEGREAIDGYVAGANAWIDEVLATGDLPAEYALLTTAPRHLTREDVVATGVLMTRFVASEGGTEMANVAALRGLEDALGEDAGRAAFQDLVWTGDERAVVTVPREEGVFPRTTLAPSERQRVFDRWADYARTVPLELAEGQGTGAHPTPGAEDLVALSADAPDPAGAARAALEEWRSALTGGSFLVAIGPERTADGDALLMSEPQLGYDPTLLVELEVHGDGYKARGTSVAGVPTVGIGYGERVAWALTTGNAKTIDSYIETTRPDSDDDGVPEYRHDGVWKPMTCRDEDVHYRAAVEGVPVGPPAFTETVQVCRTVHGPVVATSEDGTAARSLQYAMWGREVETIDGILQWNRARNLEEFAAGMRKVTWNENTGYADADGNIAFWHPGLHHVRPPESDLRLPLPGTGEWDMDEHLPFEALPHTVNPRQGYVVNWNNKPAHGWGDGVGMSYTSYPAGHGQRVTNLVDVISSRSDWTFDGLRDIDRYAATRDMRATEFLPLLLALEQRGDLGGLERAALELLAGWDGSANSEGADMRFTEGGQATVGAAATIFAATVDALRDELLHDVDPAFTALAERQHRSGRHVYDVSPALNLVLRVVDPSTSSLTPSRDYLEGRTAAEALRDALSAAVEVLAAEQGEDPSTWRSPYQMEPVCSPTGGAIGPCVDMPFLERGTWIHLVGFPAPAGGAPVPAPAPPAPPLPTTGPLVPLALPALLALALAGVLTRRRVSRR
ncbi:MAG: penicillin acylase family protein [Actinobacteria bacterium]|nr:penicillin acylase family protein [Actinomycetota bacterium]